MDLKTFVSETLTQIVAGVADAKREIEEMAVGAAVNPAFVTGSSEHGPPSDVEFDVAVTVVSTERTGERHEASGSAGGVLAVVGLKVSGKLDGEDVKEDRREGVSRVKFSVKLAQPANIRKQAEHRIPRGGRGVV